MLGSYLVLIDREDDKRAFEFLYEENCGKMFTIAYNICKSEVLAEDAVADAFLGVAKTFSKFSSLDEEDKIPYLIRAVKNSALNVVRREKNTKYNAPIESLMSEEEPSVDFFEQADLNELIRAVKTLDERYKSALTYKIYYNMSIDEISDVMGVSRRTVSYYLKKAREEIEQKIT